MRPSALAASLLLSSPLLGGGVATPAPAAPPPLELRLVTDEAEAVLAILAARAAGAAPAEPLFTRLFESEGYRRLARREAAMGRAIDPAAFRAFVLSDALLSRREALAGALDRWRTTDLREAGRRARAYLPAGARLKAAVYPVIKPRDNSFVFELATDPAIFFYLDPEVPERKLLNTVAHELHHVGLGSSCPPAAAGTETAALPEGVRRACRWTSAFGEGLAMLAAAPGPGTNPHADSPAADRERWDRDVAAAARDLPQVAAFLLDVARGRLTDAAENERGMSFFGVQGPWYTVGWRMAVTVEEGLGRERLVSAFCDPRGLIPAYHEAATLLEKRGAATLPRFPGELLSALAIDGAPASPR